MGASSSSGAQHDHSRDLSGRDLTNLYNTPVHKAEHVVRPLSSSSTSAGPFSHSGVRVTGADNSQWLVHKGSDYGKSSQTVVTDARNMGSNWKVEDSRDFQGTKTVGDFVKAGGENYNVLTDNCHDGANRMMNQ